MPDVHALSSTAELFNLGCAMEREAALRYEDLAARMRRRGESALADLFEFLAAIEGKHAVRIEQQSLRTTGQPVEDAHPRWDLPENFDEEAASSQLLTPYLALAIAVRNEERSFAFYSYVAAAARNDGIRALAEELAKEELGHATLLRRERRKAYRSVEPIVAARGPDVPASVDELLRQAVTLESAAAAHHGALARFLAQDDASLADVFAQTATEESNAAALAAQRTGAPLPATMPLVTPSIRDGLRILEESFNYYADVAERAGDETVVAEAQSFAERAVRRLALARSELKQADLRDW